MVFTVLVAVDFNQKVNFEFNFPATPTISELREKVEGTLTTEASLRRPAGMPVTPFTIHRIQVFDERMEMWVDLVSSTQLADYCQIYVFQRESPWHKDTPGRIPPPVRPSQVQPVPMQHYSPSAFSHPSSPMLMETSIPRHAAPLTYSASPYRPAPVPVSPPVDVNVRGLSPPRAHMQDFTPGDNMAPEVITHSEKVRVVFDELDRRKARSISYEDWNTVFTKLRLMIPDGPFSEETCSDLFYKKADKNEDTYVSFSEFQLFCETYPKLLDSLYFRCRDQVHHDARKSNMDSARALQDELVKRRDDAQNELDDAEAGVATAQQNEEAAANAVDAAKDMEKDARNAKDQAHSETEEVRGRLREACADRDRVKENVRQKDAALRGAQRGVDAATKKARNQETELEKAKKELERLQKLVENQMREVERQEGLVNDAGLGIENAKAKVGEQEAAKAQAEEELQGAQGNVQVIEDELKSAVDHEQGLTQAHRDAAKEVTQAQTHKSHEDQELSKARAKEVQKKAALERASRALDDHDRVVEALENKDRELEERRAQEEARENELLEQEVRLREQRECMEKKEEALRNAHQDFTTDTGRASPLRQQRTPYSTNLSA
eukprot:TRINITY_DN295_c0_g2_i1.p1 TRINITY_DN295_c0_g2~~TRINITY_DN295_c0_g2_i1.p1  ORF type:complete len:637 (+),score=205.14 TRINITY_DN295_c0_g2_i1:82-1911(+)